MTWVRTGTDDVPYVRCAWDDCPKWGHEEIKVIKREFAKTLHYLFCSENCKAYYLASPVSHGNLAPSGPRRSPLGLILPN